ncbi:mannose-1-phosphate guanylyltransferase [Shimia sp.]|uniref:mannose-1-phosphate guanylyltransferase n=1 Tax=Shimia sp. TaxID=1954381 RepID=UPI003BAD7FF2
MKDIHPLILCGGSGSRLWPLSRSQSPKQFQKVNGPSSLTFFQTTIQRHRAENFAQPTIVTAAQHQHTVKRQLDELQCSADVICEPMGRNTGPAVMAAAIRVAQRDPEGILLVVPSDHVITGDINSRLREMRQVALDGRIVIFGIKPSYPETGYGYITDGGSIANFNNLQRVASFVEKPPIEQATALLASGAAYWASGISMFTASTIIKEMKKYDPTTFNAVFSAVDRGDEINDNLLLHPESFRKATNEPTERIIFEKSKRVVLAPLDVEWDDVGCWTSMHAIADQDKEGNSFHGDVISVDTTNALVKADKRLIAVVGMSDVIVVDTPDAVLVTQRGKCQDVKEVVNTLKDEQRSEAVAPVSKDHVWGQSTHIMRSPSFDMSVIRINAGASIKLDALPGRQIIPVSGNLQIFDGLRRRALDIGERLAMPSEGRTTLTNNGNDAAEALLVTMAGSIETEPYWEKVQNA